MSIDSETSHSTNSLTCLDEKKYNEKHARGWLIQWAQVSETEVLQATIVTQLINDDQTEVANNTRSRETNSAMNAKV